MRPEHKAPCPVCKLEDQFVVPSDYAEQSNVTCALCGQFAITRRAAIQVMRDEVQPKLSAWLRERSDAGVEMPCIGTKALEVILPTLPNYTVSEKLLRLMRAIERKTSFPGEEVELQPETDYALAWASSADELRFLLHSLSSRRLVEMPMRVVSGKYVGPEQCSIRADGWDYLDKHSKDTADSDQVFVAMSFSSSLRQAWEIGIKPALEACGYLPYRIDAVPHTDRIDVKIMAEIKGSKFIVADVTEQRPGVYFEAGYAAGLGLPVVWCVRADDIDNVHFDTRQYRHILWETEEQLAEELRNTVVAIIGKGRRVPSRPA